MMTFWYQQQTLRAANNHDIALEQCQSPDEVIENVLHGHEVLWDVNGHPKSIKSLDNNDEVYIKDKHVCTTVRHRG